MGSGRGGTLGSWRLAKTVLTHLAATGAVAVVIVALAVSHGPEYIFATAILAGIIQILAGVFRLGKLMRLVPHPVIFGFVNGLAIIIFMSQLEQFKGPSGDWLTGAALYPLLGLVLLTMFIIADGHTDHFRHRRGAGY